MGRKVAVDTAAVDEMAHELDDGLLWVSNVRHSLRKHCLYSLSSKLSKAVELIEEVQAAIAKAQKGGAV